MRFVYQLQPVAGIRPTFKGRPVGFTDRLPHCDPSLRAWLAKTVVGRIWRMRRRLLGYALLWLAMVGTITQLVGWLFAWPAQFGGLRLGSFALYGPGQFLAWRALLDLDDRWIVDVAVAVSALCAIALLVRVALDLRGPRAGRHFGAERWASRADVRKSGLL